MVSGYAHVFVLVSVVSVTPPSKTATNAGWHMISRNLKTRTERYLLNYGFNLGTIAEVGATEQKMAFIINRIQIQSTSDYTFQPSCQR